MEETENNSRVKNKTFAFLEIILLVVCLAVTVLRLTITESPWPQSWDEMRSQEPAVYSLILSAVLIIAFITWVVGAFLSGRFSYRFNWIEIGIVILIIASLVSLFSASNLRAAVTGTVVLIAPLLMAVLLIQLLDSPLKIKLTLAVIAGAGFLSAYQCADQLLSSNAKVIEQYNKNPSQTLEMLGIEPGSLENFQFEHRLNSKDVKAFFTTGNSAGSFFIIAFFAALVLLIENIQNRNHPQADPWHIITAGICVTMIAGALFLTHSKGAITAAVFAAAVFAVLYYCGNWIRRNKKIILILCALLIAAATYSVIHYGISAEKLPVGKSMLSRLIYWKATARMCAEHIWTGVGASNFGTAYLHYKSPETIETVTDPHNFVLSILSQFGLLGLAALAVIIILPLSSFSPGKPTITNKAIDIPKWLKSSLVFFIPLVLIIVRPLVTVLPKNATEQEILSASIILFIIPAAAYVIGFLLATAGAGQVDEGKSSIISIALFSAILGVLIHNTIDFAIFEPPVLTAFCLIFACLIANDFNQKEKAPVAIRPGAVLKVVSLVAGLAVTAVFLYLCILPVARSMLMIRSADKELAMGQLEQADYLITKAENEDKLNPFIPSVKGRMLTDSFLSQSSKAISLLDEAKDSFSEAIKRDKQNFKNYECLSGVCILLSELSEEPKKTEFLNKAFDVESKAAQLYPGLDKLYFSLGDIAEHLGRKEAALENYKKAIEIEDAFRTNFKQMYPDLKVFSRLGEQKYTIAKQRVAQLENQAIEKR